MCLPAGMAATRSSATTAVFIPPALVTQMAVVYKHRVKSKQVETQ